MTFFCPACDAKHAAHAIFNLTLPSCPDCDAPLREFVEPEVRFTVGVFQPVFQSSIAAQPTYSVGCLTRRQAGGL